MTTKWGAQHARMIRHAMCVRPGDGKPAFVVQIVSNYNGNGQLLKWGDVPPLPKDIFPRFKHFGYFAAYPLKLHDGGKLIEDEPEVTIPRKLLEQIAEAFRTRIISDEAWNGVQEALQKG